MITYRVNIGTEFTIHEDEVLQCGIVPARKAPAASGKFNPEYVHKLVVRILGRYGVVSKAHTLAGCHKTVPGSGGPVRFEEGVAFEWTPDESLQSAQAAWLVDLLERLCIALHQDAIAWQLVDPTGVLAGFLTHHPHRPFAKADWPEYDARFFRWEA